MSLTLPHTAAERKCGELLSDKLAEVREPHVRGTFGTGENEW
jgi:hypothetical protein